MNMNVIETGPIVQCSTITVSIGPEVAIGVAIEVVASLDKVVSISKALRGSMENLDNVELTKARLAVAVATSSRNAQQGLRNQPPINKHAPPIEDLDLEQTGYGAVIVLLELGGNAKFKSPTP
ncbi:hypothetical protein HAX54_045489 [Datura stramonium]|uniref:Uncharacterized protein n=1 Tax=Datura stramonium TaxID=4076 RepID=A0ABS8SQN4_DATST|nr:hypothetical protein [Datura stramonium]